MTRRERLESALDVVIDHRGQTPRKLGGDFAPTGVPVISAKSVKRGRIVDSGEARYIDVDMWHRWMPTKLERGDVVLTSEAPLGEVALIGDATAYCLGQRLFALRGSARKLRGDYLYYWLQTPDAQRQLASRASGTTAQGVRQSELVQLEIDLPDTEVQKRRAEVLSKIDAAIDGNRRVARLLEDLFAGLFRLWFQPTDEDEMAEVCPQLPTAITPEGGSAAGWRSDWKRADLGEVGRNIRIASRPDDEEPNFPYVGLEHLPRRRLAIESWGTASQTVSGKFRFARGDILFGKLRPYFHKVSIAPTSGVCSTDILVIRTKEGGSKWLGFLLGHLSSDELIDYVDAASGGTRMPRTNWETISGYQVALPPPDLAAKFTEIVLPVLGRLESLVLVNRQLIGLRDMLVSPVMSGEIDPESLKGYSAPLPT